MVAYAILSARIRESSVVAVAGLFSRRRRRDRPRVACLLVLNLGTREVQSLSTKEAEPISAFDIDPGRDAACSGPRLITRLNCGICAGAARLTTLRGHSAKVKAVAFSVDGRHAISCARDRTLRVWEVPGGAPLATYTADSALQSLALSPDGALIAAGDAAGRVHLLGLQGT